MGGYRVILDEVVVFVAMGVHPGMGGLGRMPTQTSWSMGRTLQSYWPERTSGFHARKSSIVMPFLRATL